MYIIIKLIQYNENHFLADLVLAVGFHLGMLEPLGC
jgi:hypothetical protein